MASVRHGGSTLTEEPSRKAGHSEISADKGVVRGLGHGVHDSLEIGSLEWYSCQVWAFSSPETDIHTYR